MQYSSACRPRSIHSRAHLGSYHFCSATSPSTPLSRCVLTLNYCYYFFFFLAAVFFSVPLFLAKSAR